MPVDLPEDDVRAAVEALLGHPVDRLTWRARPIDPELRLHSVTGAVLRVAADADGERLTLVVKQTRRGPDADPGALWVSGADPGHRGYWKREWLAYASGLLGSLPGGLRAPRLLLATEPAPDEAWLWLEDVDGLPGTAFADVHYAAAARDLGTMQGAYAAGRAPLPDAPWLSRGWLAAWIDTTERWWPLVEDDGAWADDRLAALRPLRARGLAVWRERQTLLRLLDAATPTLTHHDFWPTNLFAGADGRTVALDWSVCGLGVVTGDLEQLTLDPVWMQVRPGGDLDALEQAVLPAYAEGLRAAGFDLCDAELRRWYAATAGLRYTSVLATQADLAADADRVVALERRWATSLEAVIADRARVVERALDLAEECLG